MVSLPKYTHSNDAGSSLLRISRMGFDRAFLSMAHIPSRMVGEEEQLPPGLVHLGPGLLPAAWGLLGRRFMIPPVSSDGRRSSVRPL
jgi:hypothetical protein